MLRARTVAPADEPEDAERQDRSNSVNANLLRAWQRERNWGANHVGYYRGFTKSIVNVIRNPHPTLQTRLAQAQETIHLLRKWNYFVWA